MLKRLGVVVGVSGVAAILVCGSRALYPALGWGDAIVGSLTAIVMAAIVVALLLGIARWILRG